MKRFICVIAICAIAAAAGTNTNAQDVVVAKEFSSPLKGVKWKPNSHKFGEECTDELPSGGILYKIAYGKCLGEDHNFDKPGVPILACADGYVRVTTDDPGTSEKPGWGGVIVLGHWLVQDRVAVYTIYGHIDRDKTLRWKDFVKRGQQIGTVAKARTPTNGHWKETCFRLQFMLDSKDKYGRKVPRGYDHYYDGEGKLVAFDAPYRLLDHIAPSEVLNAKDPAGLLIKEEANPKRK